MTETNEAPSGAKENKRARNLMEQVLEEYGCLWIEAGAYDGYLVHIENVKTGAVLTGTEQPTILLAIRAALEA